MDRKNIDPNAPIAFLATSLSWQHPADSDIEITMHTIYDDEDDAESDYPIEVSVTGRSRDKGTKDVSPNEAELLGRALIAAAEKVRAMCKQRADLAAKQVNGHDPMLPSGTTPAPRAAEREGE